LVTGIAGISRDVTQHKQAEEQLKVFTAKLEQSNRELQDFASVASHDLQEPLRKIQAFGDRLRSKCGSSLTAEGIDYLDRMQSAAQRMQVLINDLLTFSRVATKARPFAPVKLSEIIAGVLSDLEVRIEQKRGRVEVGELPEIDADELQLRQLFQNLIGNALKFHREGESPIVKVSCHLIEDRGLDQSESSMDDQSCEIRIEDNGIGFEEKYLDRIFDVFQRLHGRGVYEGTGIGLAVCRKIAERHGGFITAQSVPGKGSTFIIRLPLKQYQPEVATDEQTS
jgi:light-regulated signal transduction histidine kinase (bacteriophytochrome)